MKVTLSKLRSFIPSRTYKWDAKFQSLSYSMIKDPPEPFNDWFPATECEVNEYNFSEGDLTVAGLSLTFPSTISLGTVSISFIPDEEEKIISWLEEYEKLRRERYLLSDLVVGLYLMKYKGNNEIVKSYGLIVYLSSNVRRSWNSESGVETIPLEFKIVGFLEKQ
jgi:hypothetical protein